MRSGERPILVELCGGVQIGLAMVIMLPPIVSWKQASIGGLKDNYIVMIIPLDVWKYRGETRLTSHEPVPGGGRFPI